MEKGNKMKKRFDGILVGQIVESWRRLKKNCKYPQSDLHPGDEHLADDICTHSKNFGPVAIYCSVGRCPKVNEVLRKMA